MGGWEVYMSNKRWTNRDNYQVAFLKAFGDFTRDHVESVLLADSANGKLPEILTDLLGSDEPINTQELYNTCGKILTHANFNALWSSFKADYGCPTCHGLGQTGGLCGVAECRSCFTGCAATGGPTGLKFKVTDWQRLKQLQERSKNADELESVSSFVFGTMQPTEL